MKKRKKTHTHNLISGDLQFNKLTRLFGVSSFGRYAIYKYCRRDTMGRWVGWCEGEGGEGYGGGKVVTENPFAQNRHIPCSKLA